MKIKQLVSRMIWHELENYIYEHPKYRLPTYTEAKQLEGIELDGYWVQDTVEDRKGIYEKGKLVASHPLFKQPVVLIGVDLTKQEK